MTRRAWLLKGPARRIILVAPFTAGAMVLVSTGCTGPGQGAAPASTSTTATPEAASSAADDSEQVLPWQRPVSQLVVQDSSLTGMELSSALRSAARAAQEPWSAPLIIGPEVEGDHQGRLTAWFNQQLQPEQVQAVLSAVPSADATSTANGDATAGAPDGTGGADAGIAAGPSREVSTQPGTNVELVFTATQTPSTPTAAPWPQTVDDQLSDVLIEGGGLGVRSVHGLEAGQYAFTYRGPQVSEETLDRVRQVLATVAVEGAGGVVVRGGPRTPAEVLKG